VDIARKGGQTNRVDNVATTSRHSPGMHYGSERAYSTMVCQTIALNNQLLHLGSYGFVRKRFTALHSHHKPLVVTVVSA
jgi:hypothetical protein